VAEPEVVVCYYEGWQEVSFLCSVAREQSVIPQDSKNSGSVSLTIGNFRRFCAYITCDTTLNALSARGKPSTIKSKTCSATTPNMSRYRSFFAMTVCSSTSSER
jgi:hypothetical protein